MLILIQYFPTAKFIINFRPRNLVAEWLKIKHTHRKRSKSINLFFKMKLKLSAINDNYSIANASRIAEI